MSDSDDSRDREIIDLITERSAANGVPPSVREIGEHLGIARGTVQYHLKRMADRGLLQRSPGVARGITIAGAVMKQETHDA
jgi:repressor LexA